MSRMRWLFGLVMVVLLWSNAASGALRAYITGDNPISVVDMATEKVLTTISLGEGFQTWPVAVSPDGKQVYVGALRISWADTTVTTDDTITHILAVIETATNTVTETITIWDAPCGTFVCQGNSQGVRGIAVHPDGERVYFSHSAIPDDGPRKTAVYVINAVTYAEIARIPVDSAAELEGVAIHPDGSKVYVAGERKLFTIDTAADTVMATTEIGIELEGVAVTPDGAKVYVVDALADTVFVVDARMGTLLRTIPVALSPEGGIAIHPDGSKAYVTSSRNPGMLETAVVSVIDVVRDAVVGEIDLQRVTAPIGVDVSPDGGELYVVDPVGALIVIDTATNTVVQRIPIAGGGVAVGRFIAEVENPMGVLTASVRGRGVITSPDGLDCPPKCTTVLPEGTLVELVAQPDKGQKLVRWEGACGGKNPVCTVQLDGTAQEVVAVFRRAKRR